MALRLPESVDEYVYFTRRKIDGGKVVAWVLRKECPKCKTPMGKPVDPKTGKAKIRAKEYTCPKCGYTEEKKEHEATLELKIIYTCPHCGKSGEATTPCVRKTFQGVPSYVFTCEHCKQKIGISKKMKKKK